MLSQCTLWRRILLVLVGALCSSSITLAANGKGKVAIFYHIYAKNLTLTTKIIDEQIQYIKRSGLEEQMSALYYGVVAGGSSGVNSINLAAKYGKDNGNPSKYRQIGSWREGQEMKTLAKIFSYCNEDANSDDKVLYLHTKGSLREVDHQTNMRIVLHAYTLHTDCIRVLDDPFNYDTCGWRLSPLPFPHYPGESVRSLKYRQLTATPSVFSGNFWWAKCRYIRKLIDPSTMLLTSERQKRMGEVFKTAVPFYENCLGFGR
jgi:hypothetical protein